MPRGLFSRISGTGLGIPSKVLTNDDLSKIVETSDEWIRTRTGIQSRRLIDRELGESNASISMAAAKQALAKSQINAKDIDLVISCTATPDTWMPITAARVVDGIGAVNAGAFDLNAACSGFLTGLHTADGLIRGGLHKKILVVGSDVFSGILDWSDRSTCVLFGDGAGAAVVEASPDSDPATDSMILGSVLVTHFDREEHLSVKGGGSRTPALSPGYMTVEKPFVTMNGQEVFKAGSRGMVEAARAVLDKCQVSINDVKWLVPHQANRRIIEMAAKLLNFPIERTFMNVEKWGNTSAATVAICLAEMQQQNLIKKGDLVLLDVFGGGFTAGAMLVRW